MSLAEKANSEEGTSFWVPTTKMNEPLAVRVNELLHCPASEVRGEEDNHYIGCRNGGCVSKNGRCTYIDILGITAYARK